MWFIKDSGAKHTVSFFTESDDQMPFCTCKDWARWHIPCKHFFTIFREIPDWSWESLPTGYLNSSYLTTDNGALVDYFMNQRVSQDELSFFVDSNLQLTKQNASGDDLCNDLDSNLDQDTCYDNSTVPDEALVCELPKRRKDITVRDSMLQARVILQNLQTLSYNFPDKNVSLANEFTEQLDELYQSFYSRLPNEAGLIILSQAQESIRSTKRREHINRNTECASLPPRKKYKKSVDSRFGIKADRLRKEANKSMVSSYNNPAPSTFTLVIHQNIHFSKAKGYGVHFIVLTTIDTVLHTLYRYETTWPSFYGTS